MGAKQILIPFLGLLLLLAACQPLGQQTEPAVGHATSDEPTLSIGGDDLDDDSVLEPTDSDLDDVDTAVDDAMDATDTSDDTQDTTLPRKVVKEGDLVAFTNLAADDPDGDAITFTFSEPLDSDGTWQTARGDAGTYTVTVTASDGENTVSQDVIVVVESINTAPVLQLASETITVDEGELVELDASATDADGDNVDITFSGWMTTDSKRTSADDIGEHTVTVTASDGTDSTAKTITVIVNDVNYAPELDALEDVTVTEGENVVLVPTATDADGDTITYTFSSPLDSDGEWETEKGDAGTYTIEVTATDGEHETTREVEITVLAANNAPQLSLDDDQITVDEGQTVTIEYEVSDEDDDDVTVTFSGFMESATYTTTFDDAGEHTVTVTADDGMDSVSEEVTVVVRDVNRPPVFGEGAFD